MESAARQGAPRLTARTIGAVYLLYFLTAFAAPLLSRELVVPGDAAATARGIVSHEALYRSAFAVGLVANAIYIAVTALFYRLLGPVSWSLSLMAAFFSLAGCAIQICGGLLQLAPLVILKDSQLLHLLTNDQLQATALLSLELFPLVFSISFVLFALYDLLLGYLILESTFLPRPIGVLMMCAGVGWLSWLWPPLATALSPVVTPLGALAEIVLMLWLLVKGIDVPRWQERARAAQTTTI